MPANENQPPDTRSRILDAAESLIAEKGFRDFSLREVTGAAGANLAAVNYHFGSREGLVGEVLARVIEPINQQRLRLLDEAESRHAGSPVPIEEILEALHRPVVDRVKSSPHETPVYLRLAGRCLAESSEHPHEALLDLFREVIARFMAAAQAALPRVDPASLFWRMHLSVGTMIFALTHADRLPAFSGGRVDATDPEDTLRRLIEFTAAGLRGPVESDSKPPAPETRRSGSAARVLAMLAAACLGLPACRSLSPENASGFASVEVPAHWVAGPSWTPTVHPDHDWVATFGSGDLSAFVASVVEGNRDLKAARARIEIAHANAAIIGADLYPQIQSGFGAQRDLLNFIGLPLPGVPPGTVLSNRVNQFALSMNMSWELDLWGRIRAAKSAAVAEFEASDFDRATAELSLAGQGAKTWFALAEAREQVALARSAIATFTETETAIRERFERGVDEEGQSSAAQLLLAGGDVATAREALAAREDLEGRTARLLELLAGRYPEGRAGRTARMPEIPGRVPAGLPASLLDRRPDLAAAERRIASADRRLLEAKRSLLPAVSLTSNFGTLSQEVGDVLSGDFTVWGIAANLAQPIFQGGRLRANIRRRDAELEAAAAEFEQAALTAFSEVENALASEAFLARRVDALANAARLAEAAYRRALEEFQAGTGDILTVLASQQRLYGTKSQHLQAKRERLDNRVDLHLALGGGFRPPAAPEEKSPDP